MTVEYQKLSPKLHSDERGCLFEVLSRSINFDGSPKHMYVSRSIRGTVRGFHQQLTNPQQKLVFCISGMVADFGLNIDPFSEDFGNVKNFILNGSLGEGVLIGSKVAHAFECLSENCTLLYICDEHYDPKDQFDISPLNEEFVELWSCPSPQLSLKDKKGLTLGAAKDILLRKLEV